MVLIAVLVVIVMAAMISTSLLFQMQAEEATSTASLRGHQSYDAAMAGIEAAVAVIRANPDSPAAYTDNPEAFQNQLVLDDGTTQWYFTVYAVDPDQAAGGLSSSSGGSSSTGGPPGVRYGVTDEAGKINVNTASPGTLLKLPNMTPALVDALIDYTDADNDASANGAEQDDYDQLPESYIIRNGPLDTVEELLLVKGFTPAIVFGEDANHNGVLDPGEDDGDQSGPPDNADGTLDRGVAPMLTTFAYDTDADATGKARVNLNSATAETLTAAGVSAEVAAFITLVHEDGFKFTHASQLLDMKYTLKSDSKKDQSRKAGDQLVSGVTAEMMGVVLDRLTASKTTGLSAGLVNVNTAPAAVLAAIPGFDADFAQQVVALRGNLDANATATPAWLLAQGAMPADAFKLAAPYLTARSKQFTVRAVGFGVPGGQFRVLEAVVDVAGAKPAIRYLRDVTRWGTPIAMDVSNASANSSNSSSSFAQNQGK
jgi:DNA uptake protein ComE-like DNA-binding protein